MSYRIANKKRFTLWCVVFAIIILNLIFALSKRSADNENNKVVKVSNKYSVLAADKDGKISIEENKYFKRYTINCDRDIEKIDWKESKDFIDIHFIKDDISNAKVKGDKKVEDIYYEKSKDDLTIRIKKSYNSNNFVQVSSSDSKKIVVLVSKLSDPFHHSVVLDAGHGGVDKGTIYENIYEKDINLKILKMASDELVYNGFKVTKTRDEDKFLELSEIGKVVNSAQADVFVCIHVNDFKESKYNGFSTYYYDPAGYQKEERLRLANIMQTELIKSDDWFDRGIFKENFQVLRESKIPCVLLECGFLTNPDDRAKLGNDEVLKNFGTNITNGLLKYFQVEDK